MINEMEKKQLETPVTQESVKLKFDDLYKHVTTNKQYIERLLPYITQKTKDYILKYIVPIPILNENNQNDQKQHQQLHDDIVNWLSLRKASIIVAHGSNEITPTCPLVKGFLTLLEHHYPQQRYMFFKRCCDTKRELFDREFIDMFMFLRFAGIFIVLNEFQEDGGFMSSLIKEIQDMTDFIYPFGTFMYGSNKKQVKKVTTLVFYSIRDLLILNDPIPTEWIE